VKTEKDGRRLVGLEFSEDDASRGSGGHRRVLVGLRRPLLLHHHRLISYFVILTTLFSLARREGVLEEGVRRKKKGYNRYFLHKKPRAGHVCTAPSKVNDGNGRRG
jgi:hypothetical protein